MSLERLHKEIRKNPGVHFGGELYCTGTEKLTDAPNIQVNYISARCNQEDLPEGVYIDTNVSYEEYMTKFTRLDYLITSHTVNKIMDGKASPYLESLFPDTFDMLEAVTFLPFNKDGRLMYKLGIYLSFEISNN